MPEFVSATLGAYCNRIMSRRASATESNRCNAVNVLPRHVRRPRYDFNTLTEFPARCPISMVLRRVQPVGFSRRKRMREKEREGGRESRISRSPGKSETHERLRRASRALRYREKFENLENGTAISVAVCARVWARARFMRGYHVLTRRAGEIERNNVRGSTFPLFGRISPAARCPAVSRVGVSLFPLPSPAPIPPHHCSTTLPYSAHCRFNIALCRASRAPRAAASRSACLAKLLSRGCASNPGARCVL